MIRFFLLVLKVTQFFSVFCLNFIIGLKTLFKIKIRKTRHYQIEWNIFKRLAVRIGFLWIPLCAIGSKSQRFFFNNIPQYILFFTPIHSMVIKPIYFWKQYLISELACPVCHQLWGRVYRIRPEYLDYPYDGYSRLDVLMRFLRKLCKLCTNFSKKYAIKFYAYMKELS